jgi:hypothetical protein
MDCKTAQLFLEFTRPQTKELAAEDVRALDDHLASCPDCGLMALNERRVDDHLGKAMRAVEVPDRLREHLLARLEAERGDWYKRWAGHGVRVAVAAAACVLLIVGGVYGWSEYRWANRPVPNIPDFQHEIMTGLVSPADRAEVEQKFKTQGIVTVLPDFKYRYLKAHGIAEFQGVRVPQLVFSLDGDDSVRENAIVYVLSEKQFKLAEMQTSVSSPSGYPYKVDVMHQPGGSFAYVIVYTGNGYDWLK